MTVTSIDYLIQQFYNITNQNQKFDKFNFTTWLGHGWPYLGQAAGGFGAPGAPVDAGPAGLGSWLAGGKTPGL